MAVETGVAIVVVVAFHLKNAEIKKVIVYRQL
jgi:hypothetical protein